MADATPNEPSVNTKVATGTENNPLVVKPERPFERPRELMSWGAPARVFKSRSSLWFLGLASIGIVVISLLIIFQQWTFSLAIFAFLFAIIVSNLVEPPLQRYVISTTGIDVGEKHYGYEKLKWFWFDQEEDQWVLNIATYLAYPHIMEIPLPLHSQQETMAEIETHLLRFMPIHEEGERNALKFLDKIVYRIVPWLPQSVLDWYEQNIRYRA